MRWDKGMSQLNTLVMEMRAKISSNLNNINTVTLRNFKFEFEKVKLSPLLTLSSVLLVLHVWNIFLFNTGTKKNHSTVLGQEWKQGITFIIFFHNFHAILSSTVFHNCTVVLLSALLVLSTINFSLISRLRVPYLKFHSYNCLGLRVYIPDQTFGFLLTYKCQNIDF